MAPFTPDLQRLHTHLLQRGGEQRSKATATALTHLLNGCTWPWPSVEAFGDPQTDQDAIARAFEDFLRDATVPTTSKRNHRMLRCLIVARGLPYTPTLARRIRRRVRGTNRLWGPVSTVRGQYYTPQQIATMDWQITDTEAKMLTAILDLNGADRVVLATVTGLVHAIQDFPLQSLAQLRALDGPDLRQKLQFVGLARHWNQTITQGVRAVLWRACTHPAVDVDGLFQTHAHCVPWQFLNQYGLLRQLSGGLCRRLFGEFQPTECEFIVRCVLTPLVQDRLMRIRRRLPERALHSLSQQCMFALHLLQRVSRHEGLPLDVLLGGTRHRIIRSIAAAIGMENQYRHQIRSVLRSNVNSSSMNPCEQIMGFFHRCVASGVFEPTITAAQAITPPEVYRALFDLEQEQPTQYRTSPTIGRPVHKPVLQEDVVSALRTVCRTPRETLIFLLLSRVGLRANAVHNLLVRDVYDVVRQTVHHTAAVLEKNSFVRHITLTAELREAVAQYVQKAAGLRPEHLLFRNSRHPCVPYTSLCRHVCSTLSRRAGVRHVHPHQFRTYIVNTCVQNGNSIEMVSKWLGHQSVNITFKHYYTSCPMTLDELVQQSQQQQQQRVVNGASMTE